MENFLWHDMGTVWSFLWLLLINISYSLAYIEFCSILCYFSWQEVSYHTIVFLTVIIKCNITITTNTGKLPPDYSWYMWWCRISFYWFVMILFNIVSRKQFEPISVLSFYFGQKLNVTDPLLYCALFQFWHRQWTQSCWVYSGFFFHDLVWDAFSNFDFRIWCSVWNK